MDIATSLWWTLLLATAQHIKSMSTLKHHYPEMHYSMASLLSFLLLWLTISLA